MRPPNSNEVWFNDFRVPCEDRIGEEGKGFRYLLEFANFERINIAANAVGVGKAALSKAAEYAGERVVFDNPIGSYQGVQHPLADSWTKLEQDELMVQKAAWLYEQRDECGAEANAAKLRSNGDSVEACQRAIRAHGGMDYAKEYDIERYWRESIINILAPISNEMVKNYIGEHVLGLPKSY